MLFFFFFFLSFFFFFNDPATTEIYTLSLHDALPICRDRPAYQLQIPGGQMTVLADHPIDLAEGQLFWLRFRSEEHTSELQSHHDRMPSSAWSTRLNSSHITISYAVFCLENTTELQSHHDLVCRLLLEKQHGKHIKSRSSKPSCH